MSEQAMIVRDDARLSVTFSQEAVALRDQVLEVGALIGRVTNADEQREAVEAQKALNGLLAQAEKARKAAKDPVLQFGRKIDAQHEQFVAELKTEQLRITTLVADFQQLEQARIRAAEALRKSQEEALAAERRREEEAIRQRQLDEKRKLDAAAAEVARQAREASNAEERRQAELNRLEIERQRKMSEAQSHEELDQAQERHAAEVAALPQAPVATRAEGQIVRDDWDIEVTDVWLLARAHPTCVKITPLPGEIKGLLKAGVKVAGVKATQITKATVRSGRTIAAIDV